MVAIFAMIPAHIKKPIRAIKATMLANNVSFILSPVFIRRSVVIAIRYCRGQNCNFYRRSKSFRNLFEDSFVEYCLYSPMMSPHSTQKSVLPLFLGFFLLLYKL